jgi:hypothetical protein
MRIIFFAGLFFLLMQPAAVRSQQKIRGAFTFGTNLSQVDGDHKYGFKKFGLHLGTSAIVELTDIVYFSIETLYSQMGAYGPKLYIDTIVGVPMTGEYLLKLDYVKIPLLVHFVDKRRAGIAGGFSYGRLVNVKEWEHGKRIETTNLNSGTYAKNDWDIVGELRMRIYKKLWFEVRYSYSMMKIRTRSFYLISGAFADTRNQYNNSLSFRLTYIFNDELPLFKKKKK